MVAQRPGCQQKVPDVAAAPGGHLPATGPERKGTVGLAVLAQPVDGQVDGAVDVRLDVPAQLGGHLEQVLQIQLREHRGHDLLHASVGRPEKLLGPWHQIQIGAAANRHPGAIGALHTVVRHPEGDALPCRHHLLLNGVVGGGRGTDLYYRGPGGPSGPGRGLELEPCPAQLGKNLDIEGHVALLAAGQLADGCSPRGHHHGSAGGQADPHRLQSVLHGKHRSRRRESVAGSQDAWQRLHHGELALHGHGDLGAAASTALGGHGHHPYRAHVIGHVQVHPGVPPGIRLQGSTEKRNRLEAARAVRWPQQEPPIHVRAQRDSAIGPQRQAATDGEGAKDIPLVRADDVREKVKGAHRQARLGEELLPWIRGGEVRQVEQALVDDGQRELRGSTVGCAQ